jgi:hypothetical protein
MGSPFAFDPVLSSRAAVVLASLPRSKQRQLLSLLFQLAEHPTQPGDYSTKDESNRDLQNLMVGEWHFTFWADHSAKELRIVEITVV